MKIAFVGGLSRLAFDVLEDAASAGVEAEWHAGDVRGRGSDKLDAIVRRVDEVVVFTGINSHGGVQFAKKLGRQHGTPVHIVKSAGRTVARQLISDIAARRAAAATPPMRTFAA